MSTTETVPTANDDRAVSAAAAPRSHAAKPYVGAVADGGPRGDGASRPVNRGLAKVAAALLSVAAAAAAAAFVILRPTRAIPRENSMAPAVVDVVNLPAPDEKRP